jgi:hypothetical protein
MHPLLLAECAWQSSPMGETNLSLMIEPVLYSMPPGFVLISDLQLQCERS